MQCAVPDRKLSHGKSGSLSTKKATGNRVVVLSLVSVYESPFLSARPSVHWNLLTPTLFGRGSYPLFFSAKNGEDGFCSKRSY